jgi:hypothetical protein
MSVQHIFQLGRLIKAVFWLSIVSITSVHLIAGLGHTV